VEQAGAAIRPAQHPSNAKRGRSTAVCTELVTMIMPASMVRCRGPCLQVAVFLLLSDQYSAINPAIDALLNLRGFPSVWSDAAIFH